MFFSLKFGFVLQSEGNRSLIRFIEVFDQNVERSAVIIIAYPSKKLNLVCVSLNIMKQVLNLKLLGNLVMDIPSFTKKEKFSLKIIRGKIVPINYWSINLCLN